MTEQAELSRRFAAIRQHYAALLPQIERADLWAADDAYAWDCPASGISLTPIERALWHDIRESGAVLYPQLPVGRYFVDFGNPLARVAIECDGRQWHQNAERDAKRQADIEATGWTVYRIGGRECLANSETVDDELGRSRLISSTAAALLRRIAHDHQIAYGCRTASWAPA